MTHSDSPVVSHRPIKFGSPWNLRKTIEVVSRGTLIAEASALDHGDGLTGFVLFYWERGGEILGTTELLKPSVTDAIVLIDTLLMSVKRETEDELLECQALIDFERSCEMLLKRGLL